MAITGTPWPFVVFFCASLVQSCFAADAFSTERRSFHKTIMQVVLHSIHLFFPSTISFFSISTCFSCAFTLCL